MQTVVQSYVYKLLLCMIVCDNRYHGTLTRTEASEILLGHDDGSYLVRASAQRLGEYSLSFV